LAASVAYFLELQGRVLRVGFQQRKLLIGAGADIGWQSSVVIPEIRVRTMEQEQPALKRLGSSGLVVGKGAVNTVVDAPRLKVGFKLLVNRLRIVSVKPLVQFFPLLRREGVYCAFNLLYGVQVHGLSPSF
jgi:hypothetical protein